MDDSQNLIFEVPSVRSLNVTSKRRNTTKNKMKPKSSKLTLCRYNESDRPPTKKLKMMENKEAAVLPAAQNVNHTIKKYFKNLSKKQQAAQENFTGNLFYSSSTEFSNSSQTIIEYNAKKKCLFSKHSSQIIDKSRQDIIDVALNPTKSEKLPNNNEMQLDSCSYIKNQDKFQNDDYVIDIKYESLEDEFNKMKSDVCLVLDDELSCNDKSESCSFHNAAVNSNLSTW